MTFDELAEEIEFNNSDIQFCFIINGEKIYCSKILFCFQTRDQEYQKDTKTNVNCKHATIESVRIFVDWIESRTKSLQNLDLEMLFILQELAYAYEIEKLSDQIDEILETRYDELANLGEVVNREIYKNIEKHHNYITNNINFLLYLDNSKQHVEIPYNSILKQLKYEDKINYLKEAIEKGKNPSLLSSLKLFTDKELESNDLVNGFTLLFQKSNTFFLYYLYYFKKYNWNLPETNTNTNNDQEFISSNQIESFFDNKVTEFESFQKEFDTLESNSEHFEELKNGLKQEYSTSEKTVKSIEGKKKKYMKNCFEQETQIYNLRKIINQPNYKEAPKVHSKLEKCCNKISEYNNFYQDSLEKVGSSTLQNYIFSKILLYNRSFQYMDDDVFDISTSDPVSYGDSLTYSAKCLNNLYASSDTIENNGIISITFNFDDIFIFHPLYYKLGFYGQPSEYSWKIYAKFKNIDFNKINFEENNKKLENDSPCYHVKTESEQDDLVDKKCDNSEWCLIDYYNNNKTLPHPDDSYNCLWDDPFILKFRLPPSLFPNSIKLLLEPDKNKENQKCIQQCFNYFEVTGIYSVLEKPKQENKNK